MSRLTAASMPDQSPASLQKALRATVQNVEIITGQRGNAIEMLADGASSADVIQKINELIGRLQGDL